MYLKQKRINIIENEFLSHYKKKEPCLIKIDSVLFKFESVKFTENHKYNKSTATFRES